MSRQYPWMLGRLEFGSERLKVALARLQEAPFEFASGAWAPELAEGAWTHSEQAYASSSEIAAIRWRQVDRASYGRGAELATRLRDAGYLAVFFPADYQVETEREVATAALLKMEDCVADLAGRVYLVPAPSWTASIANAIAADVAAENAADRTPDEPRLEWAYCNERTALLDECDRLIELEKVSRSPKVAPAQESAVRS